MNKLSIWTGNHFVTLMLVFTAGGFVFILAELLLERHWEGIQLVAPVSAGVGFVLALFALTRRGTLPVAVLFLALSATGLYGTLEHFEERTESGPSAQAASASTSPAAQLVSDVSAPADGEFAGPPGGGSAPPWLAPLSVSGLALLGGAGALALGRREDRLVKREP